MNLSRLCAEYPVEALCHLSASVWKSPRPAKSGCWDAKGLPLLGEAGVFLTGLSTIREHYLIRRNRPEFHILMVSHDEGGALLSPMAGSIPAGAWFPGRRAGAPGWRGKPGIPVWILLDDVPLLAASAPAGHRIWQGEEGSSFTTCSAGMQGGIRSPLQPPAAEPAAGALGADPAGGGARHAGGWAGYRRCFGGWRRVWTSLSVALLADQMACSVPHLHRLLPAGVRHGPTAWLTGLPHEQGARQVLLYTNWPLAELAARVGYQRRRQLLPTDFRRLTGQGSGLSVDWVANLSQGGANPLKLLLQAHRIDGPHSQGTDPCFEDNNQKRPLHSLRRSSLLETPLFSARRQRLHQRRTQQLQSGGSAALGTSKPSKSRQACLSPVHGVWQTTWTSASGATSRIPTKRSSTAC